MTKKSFNLRNVVKIGVACLAVLMFVACSKKDEEGAAVKFSPPAWIQGSWGAAPEGVGPEIFNFTSNDVLMSGVSLKTYTGSGPGGYSSISETKKTDNLYEITIKAKASGSEAVSGFFSFKKGDGTYIYFGTNETGSAITDYGELYKR